MRLTRAASTELEALGQRRRGMLVIALGARARGDLCEGLLTVWTPVDVAVCEVVRHRGRPVVLVYAVRSGRALLAALLGPELDRRFQRLLMQRLLHRG
jgi:hypothetical protein